LEFPLNLNWISLRKQTPILGNLLEPLLELLLIRAGWGETLGKLLLRSLLSSSLNLVFLNYLIPSFLS